MLELRPERSSDESERRDVIAKASEYKIELIIVPAGLTWKLQPLDVGVMGPFKSSCNRIWSDRKWNQKEATDQFHVNQVQSIIEAWETLGSEVIVSAFRNSITL